MQPLLFSNDLDWDGWDLSLDDNFWMTDEEKNVLAEQEKLEIDFRVCDEQEAAEALFDLFGSGQKQTNATSSTSVIHQEDIELGTVIQKAAEDIVDNSDLFEFDMKDTPFSPTPIIHEIPEKDVIGYSDLGLNTIQTAVKYDVIPVENKEREKEEEERERREEERILQLKEKSSYSILKDTQKHKDGIQGIEKGKKEMLIS